MLKQNKLDEIELTALRNEMREWQGRRFILATIAGAFVGTAIGLSKDGSKIPPYYRTIAVFLVLWVLAMLSWYATQASRRGRDFIRKKYPTFDWENEVDAVRFKTLISRFQLHHTLLILYLVLGVAHGFFAYLGSGTSPRYFAGTILWPTIVVGAVIGGSWGCAFWLGLSDPANAKRADVNVCKDHTAAKTKLEQQVADCPRCQGDAVTKEPRTAWSDLLLPQAWLILAAIVAVVLGLLGIAGQLA